MALIGLHGYARSGKDSVGAVLIDKYGFTRVALADAVRDAVYALNPLIPWRSYAIPCTVQEAVDAFGWDELKATDEGRRLLQAMGTEVGREIFGKNVWLDIAAKKIDAVTGPVVVTDIRFDNELLWLGKWTDSVSAKVARPGYGPVNGHSSDAGIKDHYFDYHIKNDGSLEDLETRVDEMVRKYWGFQPCR